MPTAQEYFQRVFDRYPVAWDEGPFLYRQLNFARNQVALDCDVVKKVVYPAKTDIIILSQPFLAVRKVYYKKGGDYPVYMFWSRFKTWLELTQITKGKWHIDNVSSKFVFSYELKYKATPFSPFPKWSEFPTNFYVIYPNRIQILPPSFVKDINSCFEIYYVPKCQDMTSLTDIETDLPEQLAELVVLQVCMRLAENDLQYAVKQYFENEYKLQLLKVPKASYLYV
ncbi:MAG: hypothetical protein LM575_08130 [Caldimicrobium sp.]|nr:hypothetical protein [Caldimicrobium sp.]